MISFLPIHLQREGAVMDKKDEKKESRWSKVFNKIVAYAKGVSAIIGLVVLISGIGFTGWFVVKHTPNMGCWSHEAGNSARTGVALKKSGPISDNIACRSLLDMPDGYRMLDTSPLGADGRIYFIMGKEESLQNTYTLEDADIRDLTDTFSINTMREISRNEDAHLIILKVVNDDSAHFKVMRIPMISDGRTDLTMTIDSLIALNGIDKQSKLSILVDNQLEDGFDSLHVSAKIGEATPFYQKTDLKKNLDDENKSRDNEEKRSEKELAQLLNDKWDRLMSDEIGILDYEYLAIMISDIQSPRMMSFSLDDIGMDDITLTIDSRINKEIDRHITDRLLVCADADTGDILWEFGSMIPNGLDESSALSYSNGQVYISSGTDLYSLESISGYVLRQIAVSDESNPLYSRVIKPVIITNIWDRNERLVSKTRSDKAGRMQEVTNKAYWRDDIDYVSSYTDLVSSKNKLKAYIKMVGMNPSEDTFDINRNVFNADKIVYWNIGHGNCYKQTIKEMLFPDICETYNNQWQSDFIPPKDILEFEIGRNILMRMIDTNYEIRSSIECINDLSQLSENIFSGLGGYDPYLFPYILHKLYRYVNIDICDDANYQRCVEMISENDGVVGTIIKFKTLIDHNVSPGFNAYIDWDSFLDEHMMFLVNNTNSLTNHISDKCFITSISACDGDIYVMTKSGYLLSYDSQSYNPRWISLAGCAYDMHSQPSAMPGYVSFSFSYRKTSSDDETGNRMGLVVYQDSEQQVSCDIFTHNSEASQNQPPKCVTMSKDYFAFIQMNQLFIANTDHFFGHIDFSQMMGGATQPVIIGGKLFVCFDSGLYNIDLAKIVDCFDATGSAENYNELIWDSNGCHQPNWVEWWQEWQNLNRDAVIAVYDNRIVTLQGDEIRCFALKARKDEDSSIVGRCVWACSLQQTEHVDETMGHMLIFNSGVYVPHKHGILMFSNMKDLQK